MADRGRLSKPAAGARIERVAATLALLVCSLGAPFVALAAIPAALWLSSTTSVGWWIGLAAVVALAIGTPVLAWRLSGQGRYVAAVLACLPMLTLYVLALPALVTL